MALSMKLYRVVGKGKDRRYIPIAFGRRGRRSKEDVTGPFYLRYGVKYESVGMDFKTAVEAMQRRQSMLDAVGSGVAVKPDGDPNRKRVVDEVKKFLAKKSLLKDRLPRPLSATRMRQVSLSIQRAYDTDSVPPRT